MNHDCVLALLLTLESESKYNQNLTTAVLSLDQIANFDFMKPFTREEIFYTAEKLKEANIIELDVNRSDQGLIDVGFGAITFIGHAYLDSIRSASAWSGLKKV